MNSRSQSGFAVVETLLVVVILALIGGTGYYVWHSKQVADKNYSGSTGSSHSVTSTGATKPLPVDTSDNEVKQWVRYVDPAHNFTMRLADGWRLERFEKETHLYAFGSRNVQYHAGVPAVVTEISGGGDGTQVGLFIDYFKHEEDATGGKPQGNLIETLKTAQGNEVSVWEYTETTDQDGLGGLPKGGTLYTYATDQHGSSMQVGYGIGPEDQDQHEIVDKAIESFTFLK